MNDKYHVAVKFNFIFAIWHMVFHIRFLEQTCISLLILLPVMLSY